MGFLDTLNQLNPVAQAAGLIQGALSWGKGKPTTTQAQYDDLVHYFKFASSAYALIKLGHLNGATIVTKMFDLLTDTHGYVARDDTRKEIIVAFRGSVTPTNFAVDFMFIPCHYNESLVPGAMLHTGFSTAWMTVAKATMAAVEKELDAHPGYSVVTLGHSLGGAMASIAGVEMKEKLMGKSPLSAHRIYTYGAPRVGNGVFCKYATDLIGVEHVYRVVHACDGVPTMVPVALGFQHYGTEYWHLDPSGAHKTFICNGAGPYKEDPEGSCRVPTTGINPDHLIYFVIPYITPFYI